MYWPIHGLFLFIFVFSTIISTAYSKYVRSNRGTLVYLATTVPTEPNHCPRATYLLCLFVSYFQCFAFFILQGPGSRRLKFSLGFPVDYHSKILTHLENSSSDLEIADFRGLWLQGPNIDTFCRDVISKMSQLRQMSLPHIATDNIIGKLNYISRSNLDGNGSNYINVTQWRKIVERCSRHKDNFSIMRLFDLKIFYKNDFFKVLY